jgi:hypothetical protein
VAQLEEEFFRQGDVEQANHMSISPLFDRNQKGITKSQVGTIVVNMSLACFGL